MTINQAYMDRFIENAIAEDVGDGDHTSLSCIPSSKTGKAQLLIKQDGIIAGIQVASSIFQKLDGDTKFKLLIQDGSVVHEGEIAFLVEAKVLVILKAERLVLNVMQRMSGIATQTNHYVKKLEGLKTKVLDTRKTTPGMRLFDKAAVKMGGGENHRFGLYDMILLKDNHIDFAGGIENAIQKANDYLNIKKKNIPIEIEARSLDELKKILAFGKIHRIMLDNFTPELTKQAVSLINGRYETESSGNITLDNIRNYAECGVDYISVGALTHQIQSLDLSLKAIT